MLDCSVAHFLIDVVHGFLEERPFLGSGPVANRAEIGEGQKDGRHGQQKAHQPEGEQQQWGDGGGEEKLSPHDH